MLKQSARSVNLQLLAQEIKATKNPVVLRQLLSEYQLAKSIDSPDLDAPEPVKVLSQFEQTETQFRQAYGPERLKIVANYFLGDFLKKQTFNQIQNLKIECNGQKVLKGNFIEPKYTLTKPQVSTQYLLILADMDYPQDNKVVIKTLWIHNRGQDILPYTPPHPERGTGIHRYMWMLFDSKLQQKLESQGLEYLLNEAQLRGLAFHRSAWDKTVSEWYGQNEPVYGKVLERPWKQIVQNRLYKYAYQ